MLRRLHRHRHSAPPELNITAFMNLMVILVPFLLITAVFSRLAILELNIPPANSPSPDDQKEQLQLEVTIRKDSLEVGDRKRGLIKRIDNNKEGYNFSGLSDLLQMIKARTPDISNATILSESEISYEALIKLMDTVRTAKVVQAGSTVSVELFPDIAIGDAPIIDGNDSPAGAAKQ
ncbi:MAG: ExbD/TolR family protein [Gammaproteobacteria bacterium]